MGKQKKKKKSSPHRGSVSRSPDVKSTPPPPPATVADSPRKSDPISSELVSCSSSPSNAQSTISVIDLAIVAPDLLAPEMLKAQIPNVAPVKVSMTSPEPTSTIDKGKATSVASQLNTPTAPVTIVADPETIAQKPANTAPSYVSLVKGSSKQLSKKGVSFILPSGEACIKIPNAVIEKNRKSWDCFVLGQFYSEPPSQGIIQNIVNGIWSRQYRDVSVSKMEGFSFLFRIPNSSTRSRVINQRLWQIEGQTMFVAKWEPGVVPTKPELSSAPIWLELRNVPLQFFHEDGLERIAGLVGDPKFLHPSTANKTNLEVAKVFTIIDPRKPLPEAVNVQFDSGQVKRILVSSPWMPPVCAHCKDIGHSARRCSKAPISCSGCNSSAHSLDQCPRTKTSTTKRKYQKKKTAAVPATESAAIGLAGSGKESSSGGNSISATVTAPASSIIINKELLVGESSGLSIKRKSKDSSSSEAEMSKESNSEVEEDSSDILSSEPEEDVSLGDEFLGFTEVSPRKRRSETHVQQSKSKKFIAELLPGWFLEDNYAFSDLGKIWILWHQSVKVVVISKSLQMVTCEVLLPDVLEWIVVSIIYASNEERTRYDLWAELVNMSTSQALAGKAWIVLGDFNQIKDPSEHSNLPVLNVNRQMRDFRGCLEAAELSDLVFRGSSFTWWNKSKTRPITKKLDRVLVTDHWSSVFPEAFATFGDPDFSDHACCGVLLRPDRLRTRSPFKFFNFLLLNQEFIPLVACHWFACNFTGSDMFRLSKKLKSLKSVIRSFAKDNFSGIEKRVNAAHEKLLRLQNRTLAHPTVLNAHRELAAQEKWLELATAEESFFCQKSRITWMADGDSNTTFFHRMAATRRSMNQIHYMIGEDGTRFDNQMDIKDHCVTYFSKLLGGDQSASLIVQSDMELLLPTKCSPSQKIFLEKQFTDEEIKEAFFSLPKNKTCGPDGYSAEFFTGCWTIIGAEVIAAVKEFFVSGKLLKQWNATTLVLIPKVTNASRTSDFRPISCLNTVYKVISKLLASKLQSILSKVISPAQSAFMPGRLLAENVLLATEVVQGYNRKHIQPRAMLKVDLRKAFDSVSWEFILSALRALDIPAKFLGWIKECITTPSFLVCVNGTTSGFFKSSRGLRQGDPLSPYLFVLVMEVFSKLLLSRFDAGYIKFHPKTAELSISHLMFADDVMIFFYGSEFSLHGINEALDDFANWSGLQMNREKTNLFHAGMSQTEAVAIARHGFEVGNLPIRYLGLPLMHRKLRIAEYDPLIEKISARFRGWAVKSLSFAGRTQLIASVIYGTVNFWMTTFMIPIGCIKKIESLCSRFLWSGNIESGRGAKVAWSGVCLPKNEGGLGLRRFREWNTTLCLRFIWLLFSENDSLWARWHRHHNIGHASFWSLNKTAADSWTWKSLLHLRPLAEKFLKCVVGNGQKCSFWYDSWTPLGPLSKFLGEDGPRVLRLPLASRVNEAVLNNNWAIPSPRSDPVVILHAHLTTIQVPCITSANDQYCWVVDNVLCQGFSAKRTWEALMPRSEVKDWASSVWFKGAIPKHAFNMWISHLNRLPTRKRLASWGLNMSTDCCLCSRSVESRNHLLIRCPFSSGVWRLLLSRLDPRRQSFLSWDELLSWTSSRSTNAPSLIRLIAVQATVYHIWKQRNNVLHNNIVLPHQTIFKIIDKEIRNIISARRQRKHFGNLMQLWIR
ncbi:Endonuclease/exonuclease/phosphatase superfamily [Arabidopsis thaliana x Arabidopsis arenosa]|uniref:Endonuclease/exonuclease/phosphatase superfamily n=1 Tax=Arabidopsis thaliana x Arabidopsis arenosa TaxID=1240361 RepID=A0A8T2BV92_9BRAS|nr:Endonuclease/exonuclease/phosphatase superfamily [Arabidopsis thaliana x Arabidopsis arenosa]